MSPVPHTLVPLSFSCGSGGQFPHLLPGSYPKCPAHHLHFSASGLLPRPGGLTQPVHGTPWNAGGQRSYCAHGQKAQGQDPTSWPLKGPCEAPSLCPAGDTTTSSLHPFNLASCLHGSDHYLKLSSVFVSRGPVTETGTVTVMSISSLLYEYTCIYK